MIPELLVFRRLALGIGAALLTGPTAQGAADQEAFDACVADLQTHLIEERGHPADRVEAALDPAEQLPRLIELDRSQPEFVQTFWDYLDRRVTPERVDRGRRHLDGNRTLLWQVHEDYGVAPRYLIALWGMETDYGSYFGRVPTIDALTTLACEGRRETFFTRELDALLHVMHEHRLERDQVRGSWAGALGHTQFMPSTFRDHAVDYDGSGQVDLWGSLPDVMASSANFLRQSGWQPGERWGREVRLTDGFDYTLADREHRKPLDAWDEAGVRRADGSRLPSADMQASLVLPMGRHGPAFLVYRNFEVLMRWNASVSYALATGHLADRLDGQPPLRADRPDPEHLLEREGIRTVQRKLDERGYDPGPVDGLIGPQTRQAVRRFQQDEDLPPDGYPDRSVLEALLDEAPGTEADP